MFISELWVGKRQSNNIYAQCESAKKHVLKSLRIIYTRDSMTDSYCNISLSLMNALNNVMQDGLAAILAGVYP